MVFDVIWRMGEALCVVGFLYGAYLVLMEIPFGGKSAVPLPLSEDQRFVVCLENKGYEASLARRKIYQILTDPEAAKHAQARVIDESGGDCLYPQSFFAALELPQHIRSAVLGGV